MISTEAWDDFIFAGGRKPISQRVQVFAIHPERSQCLPMLVMVPGTLPVLLVEYNHVVMQRARSSRPAAGPNLDRLSGEAP